MLQRQWIREARRDWCHEVDRCASKRLQWSRHLEKRDRGRCHATSRDFVGNALKYRALLRRRFARLAIIECESVSQKFSHGGRVPRDRRTLAPRAHDDFLDRHRRTFCRFPARARLRPRDRIGSTARPSNRATHNTADNITDDTAADRRRRASEARAERRSGRSSDDAATRRNGVDSRR